MVPSYADRLGRADILVRLPFVGDVKRSDIVRTTSTSAVTSVQQVSGCILRNHILALIRLDLCHSILPRYS